jgi:two-component system KDP operon response regulator KdpE
LAHLREKLEANPAQPELLITEPGVGYRLVCRE